MAGNTLDVYRSVKRKVENEFRPRGLTVKTAGFKQDGLAEALNEATGFWEEPNKVASKPPRWIIQFEKNHHSVTANFAKKQDGAFFPASNTVGYINNREGNCSAMIFRIIAAVKIDAEVFTFPDWEWVMLLVFDKTLPAGNSSETIASFNPTEKTIVYQRRNYRFNLLGIVKTTVENETVQHNGQDIVSYPEATDALLQLLENGAEVVNT